LILDPFPLGGTFPFELSVIRGAPFKFVASHLQLPFSLVYLALLERVLVISSDIVIALLELSLALKLFRGHHILR